MQQSRNNPPRRSVPTQGRPVLTPQQRRRRAERRRRQLRRRRITVLVMMLALILLIVWGSGLLHGSPDTDSSSLPQSSSSQAQQDTGSSDADQSSSSQPQSSSAAQGTAALSGDDVWLLRLVNHDNPLPEGFTVETAKLPNGLEFDQRAIEQLEKMLADGNAAGLQLMVCSAYRSVERQDELFNEMLQEYIAEGYSEEEAYEITSTIRTPHGCSEHSTGLAADIVAVDYQMLDDGYGETDEAKWLLENAADYGFILRYPKEKEDVTGIIWEPWHYRYVGVENAKKIKASGLCLEEYLKTL